MVSWAYHIPCHVSNPNDRRRRRPAERERSGRIGSFRGRPARTFHCNFGSVRVGDGDAGAAIDYAARIGETVERTAELEHVAGDPDRLRQAAEAVDASARVRRGPTAERVLVKQTVELPADAPAERRAAAAEAIVADWEARGHVAIAAIHGNDLVQPHLHVLATARPVDAAGTVDRSATLWSTKQAVRDERARIAAIVNEACRPEVEFHPGRLEDTGIERKAKRRVPARGWHVRGDRAPDPEEVAKARKRHEARRAELAARPPAAGTMIHLDVAGDEELTPIVRQISGTIEFPQGLGIDATHPNAAELAKRFSGTGSFRPKRGDVAAAAEAATSRAGEAQAEARELRALTERQAKMIQDVFAELGVEVSDLDTDAGRAEAFARVRAARARPRPPARTPEDRAAAERQAAATGGPWDGVDDRALRQAWREAGRHIRQATRDLKGMPHDFELRRATEERLRDARSTREAAAAEAARRGIELVKPPARPGRGR